VSGNISTAAAARAMSSRDRGETPVAAGRVDCLIRSYGVLQNLQVDAAAEDGERHAG